MILVQFSLNDLRNLRQGVFVPVRSEATSLAGIRAQNTVTGEISVQNVTAQDGLKLNQGGSAHYWVKLKV